MFEIDKPDFDRMLTDAHNRASENAQQNRRRRPPKQGTVRLSNTDSIGRANRIRARLRAKIGEIMSSPLDDDIKKALARNVQMQLDRVEDKIRQIRRRERAKEEEKRERASREQEEQDRIAEKRREEARRRRQRDMRQRSINIRKDFLFSAEEGGFDPMSAAQAGVNMSFSATAEPSVAFSVAGHSGVAMSTAPMPAGDMVDVVL